MGSETKNIAQTDKNSSIGLIPKDTIDVSNLVRLMEKDVDCNKITKNTLFEILRRDLGFSKDQRYSDWSDGTPAWGRSWDRYAPDPTPYPPY